MLTLDYLVYVARAHDSKHGEVAIKVSHPTAIERESAILTRLKKVCVPRVAHVYALCHYRLFRDMTLQLFVNSLVGGRLMELEKLVSMGISMVRVNVKLPFLHSFGLRALFF